MKDYLEEWKKELFYTFDIAMHGHDDNMLCKECTHKYWDLIDNVMINPSLVQVRTLFRLFNNEPDYGILEGCYRVLSNVDDEIFIKAFINELVTVYYNAPEWCVEFFERAIDQEIFFEYVIGLDADKRNILIKLIKETKEEDSQLSDKCDRLLLLIDAK